MLSFKPAFSQHTALMCSFPNFEPVHCSMSDSKCCFVTCKQISQEAGQVVWYSYHFENFSQILVIHTVKGFGIVNKAEIDFFLEFPCFPSISHEMMGPDAMILVF